MSVCVLLDNSINSFTLWIIVSDCVLVKQSDTSVPISRSMIMEFLFSCNVFFLFSACFYTFHRNLSFSVQIHIIIPVSRPRFLAWYYLLRILDGRLLIIENSPLTCFSPRSGYSVSCTIFSSLLCSIYHIWRILMIRSFIHSHKLSADARRKREERAQTHPALEVSHMRRVFTSVAARSPI